MLYASPFCSSLTLSPTSILNGCIAMLMLVSRSIRETAPKIMAVETAMTRDGVAEVLARTLTNHPRLLRLLSMNLYEMEANSRPERLTEFKKSFGASLETVDLFLRQYIPEMGGERRSRFVYAFFPFIYGIYPYTSVTEKQMDAMREAGIPYRYQSAFELTFECTKKLLEG